MITTDTRSTRIAVFIDFDNVEIGVKSTIGGQFDIGLVLEAIKERGEIVTKIAYSDWKRAGDYSRLLTQHAIRMVQRNLTPGGDKNGADITMALDALEMAFTHDHINAFVIVGGDSDFISLVEKLKQYGRKVIVVGGRQFTSATMQRNCHEFIAYENLVGSRGGAADRARRPSTQPPAASDIGKALPLVKRALKVLSRARSDAAARPAEEHAAAARLDVLGARVRRQQLPRLHGEGGPDRRRDAEARRPQHARRIARRRPGRGGDGDEPAGEGCRRCAGAVPGTGATGAAATTRAARTTRTARRTRAAATRAARVARARHPDGDGTRTRRCRRRR